MNRTALRVALVFALALTLVVLAGCSALQSEPTREERAVDAVDRAHEALQDVETYRYDTDLTVSATADGRHRRIDAALAGTVDVDARTMHVDTTVDGETSESYLIGRTVYQRCPEPWGGWGVDEVPDDAGDAWVEVTPALTQLALTDEGSLYWNGTHSTDDGREATLVTASPPPSALDEDQGGIGAGLGLASGPSIEDVTVELWLDPETDLPLETSVEFEVDGDGGTATASSSTRYAEYDEPVSIEWPDGGFEDRRELGCPMGPSSR